MLRIHSELIKMVEISWTTSEIQNGCQVDIGRWRNFNFTFTVRHCNKWLITGDITWKLELVSTSKCRGIDYAFENIEIASRLT